MPDHPSVPPLRSEGCPDASSNASEVGSGPALALAGSHQHIYDSGTLAELEGIFGRARLLDLLGRLKAEITQRLQATAAERAALGHDAHTLLSVSGSLGFFDLSQRCAEMEQAYLRGADLDAPLEAARSAATRAVTAIEDITAIEATAAV